MDISLWQRLDREARDADRHALHDRLTEFESNQNRFMEALSESLIASSISKFRVVLMHVRCTATQRDGYHLLAATNFGEILARRPRISLHFTFCSTPTVLEWASSVPREVDYHIIRNRLWTYDRSWWLVSDLLSRLEQYLDYNCSGKVYKGTWNHSVVALKVFKTDSLVIPNYDVTISFVERRAN